MATVSVISGESREALITIDSERTPTKVSDIREIVDNTKNVVPSSIISFTCQNVPTDQACKDAMEFVQGGNGNWAKTGITMIADKKTEDAWFTCALPNRKDRVLQMPCYLHSVKL